MRSLPPDRRPDRSTADFRLLNRHSGHRNLRLTVPLVCSDFLGTPIVRSAARHRSGAAIVEFAIGLPILVLILFGTIETTNMLFVKQSLKIAAYEATRVAIVPGADQANVQAAVDDILKTRQTEDYHAAIEPADFESAPVGDPITVRVTAGCDNNGFFPSWFYGGRTVTAYATMMKEWE